MLLEVLQSYNKTKNRQSFINDCRREDINLILEDSKVFAQAYLDSAKANIDRVLDTLDFRYTENTKKVIFTVFIDRLEVSGIFGGKYIIEYDGVMVPITSEYKYLKALMMKLNYHTDISPTQTRDDMIDCILDCLSNK